MTTEITVLPDLDLTDRDTAIAYIKEQLFKRTGYRFSVRGGRGTAWGWINIDAQPKDKRWSFVDTGKRDDNGDTVFEMQETGIEFGYMSPELSEKLAKALGLDNVHHQGVSIPASGAHRREYCKRASGRPVTKVAEAYWD